MADTHEAHDLTQVFFAELLEKEFVNSADPERGRFRSFLLTAFKHFLSKEWDKAKAQKRGGGRLPLSLDFETADSSLVIDPPGGLTPDQIYDQQWAITLLAKVMERLQAEFQQKGKSAQFEKLKDFMLGDHAGTTYAVVGEELGMSESAAKKAASRMRRKYRELLREEISQTVSGSEDVEEEICNLFSTFDLS